MELVLGFIYKYFFDALIVLGFGIVSKIALRYFSNDRWETIKETVLTSMLWAEEQFGIGHGDEKWTKAWKKIIELLQKKGIKLSEKEIPLVSDIMKSNIPKINSITYSALPPEATLERDILKSTPEYKKLADILRKKHPEKK
jgi:Asp-tRNA(Asn)/Glu-tRNA(Gln) amidotransferase A subunit family amidase